MNSSSDHQLQQHRLSQQTSDALLIANASKPGVLRTKVESITLGRSSPSKGCSYSQEEVEEGRLSVASSVSVSGSWHTETSGTKDCNHHRAAADVMWSHSSSDCSSKDSTLQQLQCGSSHVTYGKLPDSRSQVPCNLASIGSSKNTIVFQLVINLVNG